MEITQKKLKFLVFIDSLTPLISSLLQNGVFLQKNSSRKDFELILNSFKVKSKEKETPFHAGISKVLAVMIYDYFCIGIVTLKDNQQAKELFLSLTQINDIDPSISDIKSFLNKLIILIQDKNSKIPFINNEILHIDQIISSLLDDLNISKKLYKFFIQNFKRPISYNQMKSPFYFEIGIPWEHKQKFGQVFTPVNIIDFMCEQLISEETSFIIDPAAGTGLFLLRALKYNLKSGFSSSKTIIGIEKDPVLAIICESAISVYCKLNFISTITYHIINANLFNCSENLTQILNRCKGNGIVLMNPPYTRQELLSSTEKAFIGEKVESLPSFSAYEETYSLGRLSGQSSLYVYFIIYISDFLRPFDRVGLIIPNSWMDVRYGEALKRFFLERYSIKYIISSKREKLITNVKVNTSIIFLQVKKKSKMTLSGDSQQTVKFIGINSSNDLNQINLNENYDQNIVMDVSESVLLNELKWGTYFKAPSFYFKLLASLKDHFVELETLASIKRGFTSGANAFFYLGKPSSTNEYFISNYESSSGNLILTPKSKKIKQEFSKQGFSIENSKFIIEKEYWMHQVNSSAKSIKTSDVYIDDENITWVPNYLIKSPKELVTYGIKNDNVKFVVLLVPKIEKSQLKPGIRSYISWGEKWIPLKGKNFSRRTTCDSRKFWYSLSFAEFMNFPILCIMTINDRFSFFYNANNYFFDARLYGIKPRTSSIHIPTLFCYLNSIFVSLQLELLGRINLGEGGLDVKVYEYGRIKLNISNTQDKYSKKISEKTFNKILEENPYSITNNKENMSKNLLETFLIDLRLFSQEDISKMKHSLYKIVQNRLDKARSFSKRKI